MYLGILYRYLPHCVYYGTVYQSNGIQEVEGSIPFGSTKISYLIFPELFVVDGCSVLTRLTARVQNLRCCLSARSRAWSRRGIHWPNDDVDFATSRGEPGRLI